MFDAAQIRECIARAGESEAELSTDVAKDVAFHLTDWLPELEALVEFYSNPSSYAPEQVDSLLRAFLIHAPNHLAAAAKLHSDLPVHDLFKVGAVADHQDGDV